MFLQFLIRAFDLIATLLVVFHLTYCNFFINFISLCNSDTYTRRIANEFFIGSCGFFWNYFTSFKKSLCEANSDILMHSVSGAHYKKLLLYMYVLMLFM